MHDPLTLAFSNRLFDVWHRDPEKDGSDDSCDWFGWKRPLNADEKALNEAIWRCQNIFGNPPFYGAEPGTHEARAFEAYEAIVAAKREWRSRPRRFRIPARWHVHHWHIRIRPYYRFLRWAFGRCLVCGGRFRWGEAPVSVGGWGSDGPQWFRSERIYHTRHTYADFRASQEAAS